ncbi:hypothetical protein EMIT0P74_20008 [Pseudomonas sp. IT-P74]
MFKPPATAVVIKWHNLRDETTLMKHLFPPPVELENEKDFCCHYRAHSARRAFKYSVC